MGSATRVPKVTYQKQLIFNNKKEVLISSVRFLYGCCAIRQLRIDFDYSFSVRQVIIIRYNVYRE